MQDAEAVRRLVERIVLVLVDDGDSVSVKLSHSERSAILSLRVAQGDLGKVIGKQGRTVRAIRTILSAIGTKIGQSFLLDVESDEPEA